MEINSTVFSNTNIIGTATLEVGDQSMGCVYGEFVPNDFYFKGIQKKIWQFWKRPEDILNSLRLNVQHSNGIFLYGIGGITISDIEDIKGEPLRIDIAGLDSDLLESIFMNNDQFYNLEVPWNYMSIEEKVSLENELKRELGRDKDRNFNFLGFFKTKPNNHVLAKCEFSAFARDQRNDDVLFYIHGAEYKFATVHLTWRLKKEIPSYPSTALYYDFKDFKEHRMKYDVEDFNFKE